MDDIREDLPMAMTMAAFAGVAWYIALEINISLFTMFKRRRGLYFWSCALVSWGIILQTLFIILADFAVWKNFIGAITMIYLSWLIMVIPQSWVLYSRLHLIVHNQKLLRWIRWVLIFNSVVFSVPTIVVGILAQATDVNPGLKENNIIWDRVQLCVYFSQETLLSLLYIYETRKSVDFSSFLSRGASASGGPAAVDRAKNNVLVQLILANLLIIALDVALIGLQFGGDHLFYLQGAFKPCVYGIKLKVEFLVLNALISNLYAGRDTAGKYNSHPSSSGGAAGTGGGSGAGTNASASRVMSAASKSRTRSSDILTSGTGKGIGEAISMEPIDTTRLNGNEGYGVLHTVSVSVTDRPATGSDARLFGKPTEPWDATRR